MKILITLNGSPKSESIIPFVAELAGRWKAEVLVARALDPLAGVGDPLLPLLADTYYQQMIKTGETYLAEVAKRLGDVPYRTFCLVGAPGECIRQLADSEQCDLIIVASHGHTGFVRWMWGSVAEGMARVAPCPVLLVRRDTPALFRQILVPIDASEPSWNVVEHLSHFVDPAYSRVTVLHCSGLTEAEEREDPCARERLYKTRGDLKTMLEPHPWLHLEFASAPAAEGIYAWLAERPCDLVAMSTHGRQGLAHLWTGSVMEQVARQANCPVLVFPPALVRSPQ